MTRPLLSMGLVALLALACSKADEKPSVHPEPKPAYKLFPTEGAAGSYAMLKTSVLATTMAGNTLKLGDNTVTLLEKRNDTLIFQLPASIVKGNYEVKLTVGSTTHTMGMYAVKEWRGIILAGSAGNSGLVNGTFLNARFNAPIGLLLDGNNIYVTEERNHTVRKLSLADNNVYTVAGNGTDGTSSTSTSSCLSAPYFLAIDGNQKLAIPSYSQNRIVRFLPGDASVTQVTGFSSPTSIVKAANGDLLIGNANNGTIQRLTPTNTTSIFAGQNSTSSTEGSINDVRYPGLWGLTNLGGDTILVSDHNRRQLRLIEGSRVRLFVGSGTAGTSDGKVLDATLGGPAQTAMAANRIIYLSDEGGQCIRMIYPFGYIKTIATSGLANPVGMACTPDGKTLYVANRFNHTIVKYTLE